MAGLQSRKLAKHDVSKKRSEVLKKTPKSSWDAKMREKKRLQGLKELSKTVKDQLEHEQTTARQARKDARQRKLDNEKKNMVVQDVKNIKAIKKLSPKQRRRARIYLKHEL
jgi:rRNA-processing protein CGR1